MNEFRLVMQVEHQHLHGDYSGTDRRYILQHRVVGGVDPWKSCKVVNFDDLQASEQYEIRSTLSDKPLFEPGDRVCIPMSRTSGTILTVTETRARVQYDHGPIGEPMLWLLTLGELP